MCGNICTTGEYGLFVLLPKEFWFFFHTLSGDGDTIPSQGTLKERSTWCRLAKMCLVEPPNLNQNDQYQCIVPGQYCRIWRWEVFPFSIPLHSVPRFGGGPAVNHLYVCSICQVEIEALAKRRRIEIDTFIKVRMENISQQRREVGDETCHSQAGESSFPVSQNMICSMARRLIGVPQC